jgi:hypothetical protein
MSRSQSTSRAAGLRRQQVEALLDGPAGRRLCAGRTIAAITVAPGAYRSSCAIDDVELTFDDGTVRRLVLKDLGPGALLPDARRVKPDFLLDPMREIQTYRHVLSRFDVGAPAMVGAVADEASGHYLLLLETVAGVPLWQVGEASVWHAAARWLAAMHARMAPVAPAIAGPARLVSYDEVYYGRWLDRAVASVAGMLDGADALRLLSVYEKAVPRLLALPRTLIHGEFHASNVLVEHGPPARVRPVDWEVPALGPALMDLADLTAGRWTAGEREAMSQAYREEMSAQGVVSDLAFDTHLEFCRLHRAVQWLSWSDRWVPPREHVQDWLGDGLAACARLEAHA